MTLMKAQAHLIAPFQRVVCSVLDPIVRVDELYDSMFLDIISILLDFCK